MTRREFVSWRAFYELEPWGSPIDDTRTALLASLLVPGGKGRRWRLSELRARTYLPLLEESLAAAAPSAARHKANADILRMALGAAARVQAKARRK